MTRWIGLDVHKRQVTFCALDTAGTVIHRGQIPCTRQALVEFSGSFLRPTDQVALEATTNTWTVVEILRPHVHAVVVSNPLRTRAIAAAKVKTDRIDARVLAELLAAGYLPLVWQPDAQTLQLRGLTHRRAGLVADRTAIKNRLHATLAMRLIPIPVDNLWSVSGRQWLTQLELDPLGRQSLESDLRLLAALEQEIEALERTMIEQAYVSEDTKLLMTLPGVGFTVAQGLLAAWGDLRRFPDADRAASYLGLAPSTRQSDRSCYHGPITKQGNSHARWLLIQAAQHLDRHPGPLGVFFRRLARKKNRNVAVVAAARKLALIAWHMLKHREPYRYALPQPTAQKLAALRIQATGKRRSCGPRRGQARPASYGSGQPTRRIPSLPEACAAENLPVPKTLEELPDGEKRVLIRTGTRSHALSVSKAHRVPRARPKKADHEPAGPPKQLSEEDPKRGAKSPSHLSAPPPGATASSAEELTLS